MTATSSSTNAVRRRRSGGGGGGSVFDAVAELDQEDARAVQNQRRSTERERDRSRAAQAQTEIYSRLVETRILLQRSLLRGAVNATTNTENAGPKPDTSDDADEQQPAASLDLCNDLLVKLLQARQTLFPPAKEDDGSDDDDENRSNSNTQPNDYAELVVDSQHHQQKQERLSNTLQSEFEHHQEIWKEVLDRRNRDVRLHSGATTHQTQFRVVDAAFWQQVENTVQHEQLRQQITTTTAATTTTSAAPVLFDDSKVYQQILKEFVAVKGAAHTPADSLRQRKLNKAAKRQSAAALVDRRASKGRKIRYAEVSKLLNFTFPVNRTVVDSGDGNDLDERAWFKSLFGGAARAKT